MNGAPELFGAGGERLRNLQSSEMAARLIINADDFGLTLGINRAVVDLHRAGTVSSATLMATAGAFDDAVTLALANPTLGVGCHVVLVDGTPVCPPESIRSLLGPDGRHFRTGLSSFARDLFLGRIDEGEMEREAVAQVERLQRAGIAVTHLDSHKHTHSFPPVARVLVRVAKQRAIVCLRNPFEPDFSRAVSGASLLRQAQVAVTSRFRRAFNRVTADTILPGGTVGIAATGTVTAPVLQGLLESLPEDGTWELCCHPGLNDSDLDRIKTRLRVHRTIERDALRAIVPQFLMLPNAPQLIHYGDLGRQP